MTEDFDWNEPNSQEDIVFPSVQGVAVYRNPKDLIVIRQQAGPLDDKDTFIFLGEEHVEHLIRALQSIVKE